MTTPLLTRLQKDVLDAFELHGVMTDEKLCDLSMFHPLRDSTVRTRRSELVKMGLLMFHGQIKGPGKQKMSLWGIPPKGSIHAD